MSQSQSPDALMPLSLAAAAAHEAATGRKAGNAEVLNNIALAMATRTRLFSRPHGSNEFVLVWPEEILEGKIVLGGEVLNFTDGRTALENLSILRAELPSLTAEMRSLYSKR
jgi:hypothetical protein